MGKGPDCEDDKWNNFILVISDTDIRNVQPSVVTFPRNNIESRH